MGFAGLLLNVASQTRKRSLAVVDVKVKKYCSKIRSVHLKFKRLPRSSTSEVVFDGVNHHIFVSVDKSTEKNTGSLVISQHPKKA